MIGHDQSLLHPDADVLCAFCWVHFARLPRSAFGEHWHIRANAFSDEVFFLKFFEWFLWNPSLGHYTMFRDFVLRSVCQSIFLVQRDSYVVRGALTQ